MRRLVPIVLPPWTLPLIVLALIGPSIAAFSLAGPHLGLAVGALTATAVIVIAARAGYDEPIEVAARPDARYRLLVLATDPVDRPEALAALSGLAAAGSRHGDGSAREPELLVVAPAVARPLDRWLSDVRRGRSRAGRTIAISLGALAAAGLDASGRIGDDDPVQATEDALRGFPADEVVVVTGDAIGERELDEVRRRLDRPVRELRLSAGDR